MSDLASTRNADQIGVMVAVLSDTRAIPTGLLAAIKAMAIVLGLMMGLTGLSLAFSIDQPSTQRLAIDATPPQALIE